MVASRQRGFNLLEILVALSLGAFVLAGMIQIYVSNQYSARYQQGLSQIQEQGRFALDVIARNLRMAGYDNPSTWIEFGNALALTAPGDEGVFGTDNTGLGGSDTLTVRQMADRIADADLVISF